MNHILLVANRKTTIDSLQVIIEQRKFHCTVASTQRGALSMARRRAPDLVIVDNTSARVIGSNLSVGLRRMADIPLIAIVRHTEEAAALGAAAYLVKPYTSQQLLGCIRRVLRRHPREMVAGSLRLDLRTRCVSAPHLSEPQRLTPKLFALLRMLMRHPGRPVSRSDLMHKIWNTDFVEDTRTLDVHIHWMRDLIEPDPTNPLYLLTVRGKGYRIQVTEAQEVVSESA